MVQINLNGQNTPANQRVQNAQSRYQKFTSSHPDFAKAEQQRRQQWNRENRAWDANSAQDAADRAANDRATAAEMREYERAQNSSDAARRKAEKERQRRDERDARLQAQLQRQQRSTAAQRDRLLFARDQFYDRASSPLRPSTLASRQREIDRLEFQNSQFRKRHGNAPFNSGDFATMRAGLGSAEGAHRTAEILRSGSFGQSAAIHRNYSGVAGAERELKKIERILSRTYDFDTNPAARARVRRIENQILQGGTVSTGEREEVVRHSDYQRQRRAVQEARSRIDSGFQGTSKLTRRLGTAMGRVGIAFNDPIFRIIKDTALATIGEPYAGNMLYSGWTAMADPYINYRKQLAQQGRAGGFSANRAQALELNSGFWSSTVPGNGLTGELARFGMSPQGAMQNYSNYGVVQNSARGRLNAAEAIRMGYTMAGQGLGEDAVGRMMGGAVSMGAVGNNQEGWNKYFRQLQGVESTAMMRGIDQSKFSQSWQSFLSSAASHGTGFDSGSLTSLFRSMAGVSPAGRSGALQQSILSGTQSASNQLGYMNPQTVAVGMAIARSPGGFNSLNTKGGVQKLLGMDNKQFAALTGTPAGKRALADLLDASKAHNSFAAMQYLGVLTQNDPNAFKSAVNGLPVPGYYKDMVLGRVLGVSTSQAVGYQAAGSTAAYGFGPGGAFVPAVYNADVIAAKKYGVPRSVMLANTMLESSGGQIMGNPLKSGAWGAGQIRAPALADFNKYNPGKNYSLKDMLDPTNGAEVEAWYLRHQNESTWNWTAARGAYHYGLGGVDQMGSGEAREFNYLRGQYGDGNSAMPEMTQQARGQGAGLKASEYAFDTLSKSTNGVSWSFNQLDVVVNALTKDVGLLSNAIQGITHASRMQQAPNMHGLPPNDASQRVRK